VVAVRKQFERQLVVILTVLRVKVSLVQLVGMVAIVLVMWYVFTMEVFGMKVEGRRASGLEKFLNIYVGKVTCGLRWNYSGTPV